MLLRSLTLIWSAIIAECLALPHDQIIFTEQTIFDHETKHIAKLPPPLTLSHSGLYVNYDIPHLIIYLDDKVLEPESLQIRVSDGVALKPSPCLPFQLDSKRWQVTAATCGVVSMSLFTKNDTWGRWDYTIYADARHLNGTDYSDIFAVSLLKREREPWPLENQWGEWPSEQPNLVGNIMENYQAFSDPAYFHNGLDIRSDADPRQNETYASPIHSPIDGQVVNVVNYTPGQDLYWSMMIRDEYGLIWQFHHMDIITYRFRMGQYVKKGDILGRVALWPEDILPNGYRYHHLHLNIATPNPTWEHFHDPYTDGWTYYNPLHILSEGTFRNSNPPSTEGVIYFLQNGHTEAFASSKDIMPPVVYGQVDMVIEFGSVFDVPTETSTHGAPYRQGLYELEWSVIPVDADDAERYTETFVTFVKNPNSWASVYPNVTVADMTDKLNAVYVDKFSYHQVEHTSILNYYERRLYYCPTNLIRGEPHRDGAWNTTAWPDGIYEVVLTGRDYYGLETNVGVKVFISNVQS